MTVAANPMTRKVVIAPPELPLDKAWELMQRKQFRHLPVVSAGVLMGIVSDRDILLQATYEKGEISVPDMPVAAVATPAPYACQPDTHVSEIASVMIERKISAAPVMDDGKLVGLVTSTDLLGLLVRLDEAKIPLPFLYEVEEHRMAA